jgi:arsenate reductase
MSAPEPRTTDRACTPGIPEAIDVEAAAELSAVFKALAEPLRVRMLSAIAADPRGECCVCDLARLADLSQPTVSHHLRVLKETGLLVSQRRGTWVWYRLAPGSEAAVEALLGIPGTGRAHRAAGGR